MILFNDLFIFEECCIMDSSHEQEHLEVDSQESKIVINNKESNVSLDEKSFSKLPQQGNSIYHNKDQKPCNGLIKKEER